ncbi:hypothetical protein H6G54_19290 [Anabaena cylindrica FACHB-243]|uniref:Uncharacterized protein n=1 Tax=Anabaena cylindrica (strain ATCC 27899 / PCC 7122) TaxID=272123 RepID=K9ZQE7_ANACC|nr:MULTISPECIES: hypothetical protein [Anabaena]AFZ60752.1 hypothetical protein Anacy_5437 [Anabaena cylindrica PCC 7122]MBD2419812.1 hypothetical protein [Anabaena cylindrica FACHB-243]MBY5281327.1 hypothetical protein [Anabaena sp. CCAP 1446/1C]MBY5309023.1 hypothetical protein [Anabaena sp. CCAP 1446/1C]MCM2406753.1 hypothetical protein [Anabaena sp. CCAP 1446/1C]
MKKPDFSVNYTLDKIIQSKPIGYGIISKYIYSNNSFSSESFNLPLYECFWLDHTIDIQINFHKFDLGSTEPLTIALPQNQMYGDQYPIHLQIDREGHIYSSMQRTLIQRIISLRNKLVIQSNEALLSDWIFDLRTLIGDTISLVEITLNQFYNKAQYDPLPGWNFDKEKVGEKFGRRFRDKLKWIGQITGNPLDNAVDELSSFHNLREIRNHMMHFDPPSLIVPLEEAAIWLNQIVDVAFLVRKIRDKIGASGSTSILNFMLQKKVIFVPEPSFASRLPLNSRESGYLCSCWPNENHNTEDNLNIKDDVTKSVADLQIASSVQSLEIEQQSGLGTVQTDSSTNSLPSKRRSTPKGFGKK